MTTSRGRIALILTGLLLGSGAAVALGFVAGRRWPIERIERIRRAFSPDTAAAWQVFATSDLPRYEMMRHQRGGVVWLFGGFINKASEATARVETLDLATGTWTRKADMPVPFTHAAPAMIRDTLWFAGGFEGNHPGPATARVWRYAFATDMWSPGPALPAPRGGGALVALRDTLHFFGGWLPDRNTDSPDHWTLAPGDTVWRTAAPLPLPRGHLSGMVHQDRIYAVSGNIGHDPTPVDVPDVHRYDPSADRWESVASPPFAVSHVEPSSLIYDDRLVTLGGRSRPDAHENQDDILAYDPAADRWVHLGRLPMAIHGGFAAIVGDTVFYGLGAIWGNDPRDPRVWRMTLRDTWRRSDSLPVALGEVAGGVIDGKLYLVGEGDLRTLVYDLAAGRWLPLETAAVRPAPGNHHAAEVVGGKLYLFGGFGWAAEGTVQVYDPSVRGWRLAARMPFEAGSSASAVIDGKVIVAGGIVRDSTTGSTAIYDPLADAWRNASPMPRPRNHAASATDGKRLYVFGGRGPGSGGSNVVADGYADVQIYDPAADRWIVSDGSAGAPPPLPQGRGGMGKAVWLNGEFWVIGGETEHGHGATTGGTYARVDIYDPELNTWRAGPPLRVARHGLFPLTDAGRILVPGGGITSGYAMSTVFETLWPARRGAR